LEIYQLDARILHEAPAGGVHAAGLAAAHRVTEKVHLPLVVWGYSLGSAPALRTAASPLLREKQVMLVLMAPLLSAMSTFFASSEGGASWSFLYGVLDMFKTEPDARAMQHHTIICHGTADKAIPLANGAHLARVIKKCVFCPVPDAMHDTIRADGMPYVEVDVKKWLSSLEGEKESGV
jgi:alpha-beta hydrolase superfamily lysophospholipase